jgi:SpoVK/Ycf46/Vps4 family AAA+-type ATPase
MTERNWMGHVWGTNKTPPPTSTPTEPAADKNSNTPLSNATLPKHDGKVEGKPNEAKPGEQAKGADSDDGINKEKLRSKIVVKKKIDVTYDDIKGQDKAVAEIKEFDDHLRFPEIYQSHGAEIPKGALLYGPPGTGKTMLAKALAGSAEFAFLSVTCADINNKYFGNPERYAEAVFDIAEEEANNHPSGHAILFLDEVEALLKARDDKTFDAAENVLTMFLTRIDGLIEGGKVIIVAATNRPDKLDAAFISRMDKLIEVLLPTADGVAAIFEVRCQKGKERAKKVSPDVNILGEINYKELGELMVGLSGRELNQLANACFSAKAHEHVDLLKAAKKAGQPIESVKRPDPLSTLDVARAAVKSGKIMAVLGPIKEAAIRSKYNLPVEDFPTGAVEQEGIKPQEASKPLEAGK